MQTANGGCTDNVKKSLGLIILSYLLKYQCQAACTLRRCIRCAGSNASGNLFIYSFIVVIVVTISLFESLLGIVGVQALDDNCYCPCTRGVQTTVTFGQSEYKLQLPGAVLVRTTRALGQSVYKLLLPGAVGA